MHARGAHDLRGEIHDLDVGKSVVGDGLVHPGKRRAGLVSVHDPPIREGRIPFVFFNSGLEVLHGLKR